ncbi:MAG: T9SS type A sorting domain-containing protein [Bacteroidales bacterium]|nr:T9SS type A sorting domain-containing protein [Bacteroidales bacterium]
MKQKRLILLAAAVAMMCSQALAQDTLTMDAPPSNYLNMVWSDNDTMRHGAQTFGSNSSEFAMRFDAKDTVQVYGLAILPKLGEDYYYYAADSTMDSVYFYARLYAADPDSLRVLKQTTVHLRDTPIAYYMALNKYDQTSTISYPALDMFPPFAVYETYFDAPVTMIDTFYVGAKRGGSHYKLNDSTYNTLYYSAIRYLQPKYTLWDEPIYQAICFDHSSPQWSYYSSRADGLYLMFPILTPDTVDHPQDSNTTTLPLEVVLERYVNLMPNPASEQVRLVSSFGLTRVEAYNEAGKRVYDGAASGYGAVLDLQGWPAGLYLLRVHTRMGVVTKKLVVR